MKNTTLTLLTSLAVVVILWISLYFPHCAIYDFVLRYFMKNGAPADSNLFRIKVSILSVLIAFLIIAIMFTLRYATRSLNLTLFTKTLTAAIFYVSIMTVVVLAGMWADFHPEENVSVDRVGFLFYFPYIDGRMPQ